MLQSPIMNDSESENDVCFNMHSQSDYPVSGVNHSQRNQLEPQHLHQLAAGPRNAVLNSTKSLQPMQLDSYESLEKDTSDSINCDQYRREPDFSWLHDFPTIPHH